MKAKLLEIRDRMTFIAALAVELQPTDSVQAYYTRRVGYAHDRTNIMLTRLSGEDKATADPYFWGDRTWQAAHLHIVEKWDSLKDGDVIDVEYILGETSKMKTSERFPEGRK